MDCEAGEIRGSKGESQMILGIAQADRTIQGDERYTPDYAVYPLLEFLGDKKRNLSGVHLIKWILRM